MSIKKSSGTIGNRTQAIKISKQGKCVNENLVAMSLKKKGKEKKKQEMNFTNIARHDRQSDRQTYRQTIRQTDRQTIRQTDRRTDRQTDNQSDRQTDIQVIKHYFK
jgi:hypothetical protein